MVIFGSLGLLNKVKEESPHMQSFVTFLLEQEKKELPADLLKGGFSSSSPRSKSSARKPQTNTRQQSPFETGVRRAVGQVAKIRDEYDDLMPDLEYEEGYREFAYPDPNRSLLVLEAPEHGKLNGCYVTGDLIQIEFLLLIKTDSKVFPRM